MSGARVRDDLIPGLFLLNMYRQTDGHVVYSDISVVLSTVASASRPLTYQPVSNQLPRTEHHQQWEKTKPLSNCHRRGSLSLRQTIRTELGVGSWSSPGTGAVKASGKRWTLN